MIKGLILEEDITFYNIHAPNMGASKNTNRVLTVIKGKIDNNTILMGDSNTPLTSMNRSSRQSINKEALILNGTLDHWTS